MAIGNIKTEADLARFLTGALRTARPSLPPSSTHGELNVKDILRVSDRLELSPQAAAYIRSLIPDPPGLPTTTSAISGGPPASPSNEDVWIATGVGGANRRWQFQYDSAAPSNKWECIGGHPIVVGPTGSVTTSSNTFVDLTSGPTLTVPRSGVYNVEFGIEHLNPGAVGFSAYTAAVQLLASTTGVLVSGQATGSSSWFSGDIVRPVEISLTGGETLKLQVKTNSTTNHNFYSGYIKLEPIRIS